MIADDRTGYGMRDGKLLFVEDVPSGLACGCACACCGHPLVAKKGSIRRHHFAHLENTNCHGAAESSLHILAKELLSELDSFVIPQYEFAKQRMTRTGTLVRHEALIDKGNNFPIHNVRVEICEGDFVPDIVIESGSKSLIVEVAVTHKVTRAKLRKIRRRDLPAIEIRLSPSDSFLSRESLKRKLQCDSVSKVWLFHPSQREAERMFVLKFRDELVHGRTKLRQFANPRHLAIRSSPVGRSASQPYWREFDWVGDEFNRSNGRYPTLDECRKFWPHLFEKREP